MAALEPPAKGTYALYLGVGKPRESSPTRRTAALGGPTIVEVDLKVGGYDHDLNQPHVQQQVIRLCVHEPSVGLVLSTPCSVQRGNREDGHMSQSNALIYTAPACRVDCAHTIGMLARCLTFPTPDIWMHQPRIAC